jgi:hypothetical protein
MVETLIARRLRDNLAWAQPAGADRIWPEVRKLWPATDEPFIRGLYQVLLGRDAEERELHQWLRFLAGGGRRGELVRMLATSEEAQQAQLDTSWLPRVSSLTPEGCWAELLHLWRQPDEAFVQGLYELLLHRPVDRQGMAECTGYLARGSSRVDLVRLLTSTEEFARLQLPASWIERLHGLTPEGLYTELLRLWKAADATFVRGVHEVLLLYSPGKVALADDVARLRGTSRLEFVRALVQGEEARRRGLDESWLAGLEIRISEETWSELRKLWKEPALPFLQGLYKLLLQRPIEPAEVVHHVSALRSGKDRVAVVKELALASGGQGSALGSSWLAWLGSREGQRVLREAARQAKPGRAEVREVLERLRFISDPESFIRRAYAVVLQRQPSADELKRQVFRLRYVPLYTRGLLVRRLLQYRKRQQSNCENLSVKPLTPNPSPREERGGRGPREPV